MSDISSDTTNEEMFLGNGIGVDSIPITEPLPPEDADVAPEG